MQDLVARLRSLDPDASESLAVIAYFDRMLESDVSVAALVRGAALLSAAPVGYRSGTVAMRFAPDGRALASSEEPGDGAYRFDDNASVWLERAGRAHANDELVLERLALAIGLASRRPHSPPVADQLEALLQSAEPLEPAIAQELLARMRLAPRDTYRAVAAPLTSRASLHGPTAILATPWGPARATLVRPEVTAPMGVGVGRTATAEQLHESWASALFALRAGDLLRSLRADDYGVLWDLARRAEQDGDSPEDVGRVSAALENGWGETELLAVAEGASLRAIAEIRGIHHSSVAARLPALVRCLTFDPHTALGRTRLHVALVLRHAALTTLPETS